MLGQRSRAREVVPAAEDPMPAPDRFRQLPLPLRLPPVAATAAPERPALAPARAALAAADRPALAAHLAALARARGRAPVPKPGAAREPAPPTGRTARLEGDAGPPRRRLAPAAPDLGPVAAFRAFVRLASVDPAADRFRVYVLAWRPTLWGDVALVQSWGRGDRPTRSRATWYARRADGERAAVRVLRRRLRRGYRVTSWQ
jgi:predicted DNA-binding WGR domain protein